MATDPHLLGTPDPGSGTSKTPSILSALPAPRGRVLLADDEPTLLRALARKLVHTGFTVETASDGKAAAAMAQAATFDVIVSDISMPGMDGLELIRAVREHDLDVPILLMTGGPDLKTAMRAVELGALRYLLKPVAIDELEAELVRAIRLHQIAKVKREALELAGPSVRFAPDRKTLKSHFDEALSTLWMAFQPIVSWTNRNIFAYEALMRTDEPVLRSPYELLQAAERLGRLPDLGRRVRERVAEAIPQAPVDVQIYVNLHPLDLQDESLFDPTAPLSQFAARVTLEITERAALKDIDSVTARINRLKNMGYRIAVDDLGTGYSGLASFTQLEPQVVKLDMSLIRDLDTVATKQKVIHSMTGLCNDLGMVVIAEGVETVGELRALVSLGGDLFQGYLFARPGRGFPLPSFSVDETST